MYLYVARGYHFICFIVLKYLVKEPMFSLEDTIRVHCSSTKYIF